jgi:hypothetical protein
VLRINFGVWSSLDKVTALHILQKMEFWIGQAAMLGTPHPPPKCAKV